MVDVSKPLAESALQYLQTLALLLVLLALAWLRKGSRRLLDELSKTVQSLLLEQQRCSEMLSSRGGTVVLGCGSQSEVLESSPTVEQGPVTVSV
jgi:hypothetical protein